MKKNILKKIQRKIRSFDLCALIVLLEEIGFERKDIYFESHLSHSSAISLCEKILFFKGAPKVRIYLNMGLLSSNTPLPSFFIKYIEKEELNADRFIRFISFFNHRLIQEFLRFSLPEKNKTLFASWDETHYHYLCLLGFESISTLWLIFKGCFPELVVGITKNARMMRLHSNTLTLGRDGLGGKSYIGERLEQTLSNIRITLTTEDEISQFKTPWPIEIRKRLKDWIYPILKKTDLHLTIILIINQKFNHLHLVEDNFLGFDRIGHSKNPFQLVLFHGFIKEFS